MVLYKIYYYYDNYNINYTAKDIMHNTIVGGGGLPQRKDKILGGEKNQK